MNALHLSLVDTLIDVNAAVSDLDNMLDSREITSANLGRRPAAKKTEGSAKVVPLPSKAGAFGDIPNPEVCDQCVNLNTTRMGLAERIVLHYGAVIRWSKMFGSWMVYNGRYWETDDDGVIIGSMVRRVIRSVSVVEAEKAASSDSDVKRLKAKIDILERTEGASPDADDLAKYAKAVAEASVEHTKYAESLEQGQQAETVLKDLKGLVLADDSKWDAHLLKFNFTNGTINPGKYREEDGPATLFEHDPEDYITKMAGVPYMPDAVSPDLDKVEAHFEMSGPGTWKALTRFLGSSLTGIMDMKTYLNMFSDKPDAAKSTFFDPFFNGMGGLAPHSYSASIDPGEIAAAKVEGGKAQPVIHGLRGKRLVGVPEAQHVHLGSDMMKRWTGGDPFQTRDLYGKPVTWGPQAKMWLNGNGMTPFTITDQAMVGRVFAVEIQPLPPEQIDRHLRFRLNSIEGQTAVMAMAVRALCEWYDETHAMEKPDHRLALCIPEHADNAKAVAVASLNPLSDWLEARCTVAAEPVLEADENFTFNRGLCTTGMLCEAYNAWASRNGGQQYKVRQFGPLLTAAGIGSDEYSSKVKYRSTAKSGVENEQTSKNGTWRRGIRLNSSRSWWTLMQA